jgi:hypothetical protein
MSRFLGPIKQEKGCAIQTAQPAILLRPLLRRSLTVGKTNRNSAVPIKTVHSATPKNFCQSILGDQKQNSKQR